MEFDLTAEELAGLVRTGRELLEMDVTPFTSEDIRKLLGEPEPLLWEGDNA